MGLELVMSLACWLAFRPGSSDLVRGDRMNVVRRADRRIVAWVAAEELRRVGVSRWRWARGWAAGICHREI